LEILLEFAVAPNIYERLECTVALVANYRTEAVLLARSQKDVYTFGVIALD